MKENLQTKSKHINIHLKFSFSEKATKMCAIVLMVLKFTLVNVKIMRTIAQIFVAFSEKLNFKCILTRENAGGKKYSFSFRKIFDHVVLLHVVLGHIRISFTIITTIRPQHFDGQNRKMRENYCRFLF